MRAIAVAAVMLVVFGGAGAARAEVTDADVGPRRTEFVYGVGMAGIFDHSPLVYQSAQVRFRQRWLGLRPWMGGEWIEGGSWWAGAGLSLEVNLTRRWQLVLEFAPGHHEPGDGPQLGDPMEFYTGGELSFRVGRRSRLALSFSHISNGGLSPFNPGIEMVGLSFVVPFGH